MLLWAKIAGLLGLSVLLMGSKVIIHVPEGGAVVSSSGLYACAAGEVCTIDVDEQNFAETFTAVAEPGYTFSGWGDGAAAICGGSQSPYCAELDSGPFSDREDGLDRLRTSDVRTMTPAFTGVDYPEAAPESRFSVRSFHATRYYPVRGNTQEELWAQLHGAANPLALDHKAGSKPLGHASFQYKYDYRSSNSLNMSDCRVESGKLELKFETVLPQLALAANTSEQLKDRWQPFQALITEHEAGHHAIYRELVTQLPQVLSDIGDVPCAELADRVRAAVTAAVATVQQASDDYDENYGGETYAVSSL